MGRKKSTAPTKRAWLVVRVTQAERDTLSGAARAAGLTLSAYVMRQCLPPEQSPPSTPEAPPT